MPNNMLTIGDVFRPMGANDVLNAVAAKNNIDTATVRNRLLNLELKEKGEDVALRTAIANSLLSGDPATPLVPGSVEQGGNPVAPATPAPAAPPAPPAAADTVDTPYGPVPKSVMSQNPQAAARLMLEHNKAITAKKVEFGANILTKAIEKGDDATIQALFESARKDPILAKLIPDGMTMKSLAPGKVEVVKKVSAEELKSMAAANPSKADIFETAAPGWFRIRKERNGITLFEPVKDPTDNSKSKTVEQLTEAALKGDKEAQRVLDSMADREVNIAGRKAKQVESARAVEAFKSWDQPTKEGWFQTTLNTGQKPSFGWGSAAALSRSQYDREYMQWLRAGGVTGTEAATASATFKSDAASLSALTKGLDAVKAFERGVDQSLTLVDSIQAKFTRTPIPGVNRLIQYMQYNAGDPDVKAFRNAVTTSMTEYMKVITAGTGISVAELTQGAQQRAAQLLEFVDNPATFKRAFEIMRQEAKISVNRLETQRSEIQKRMKGTKAASVKKPSDMTDEELLQELTK